eukprot:GILJ01000275.1.p1 GENE.GILJ01000275.1~~GILJ01000275.1.p1  ORF type:complete len:255 (+),score=37.69 GILJ01000275.1:48-767(+)
MSDNRTANNLSESNDSGEHAVNDSPHHNEGDELFDRLDKQTPSIKEQGEEPDLNEQQEEEPVLIEEQEAGPALSDLHALDEALNALQDDVQDMVQAIQVPTHVTPLPQPFGVAHQKLDPYNRGHRWQNQCWGHQHIDALNASPARIEGNALNQVRQSMTPQILNFSQQLMNRVVALRTDMETVTRSLTDRQSQLLQQIHDLLEAQDAAKDRENEAIFHLSAALGALTGKRSQKRDPPPV